MAIEINSAIKGRVIPKANVFLVLHDLMFYVPKSTCTYRSLKRGKLVQCRTSEKFSLMNHAIYRKQRPEGCRPILWAAALCTLVFGVVHVVRETCIPRSS